MALFDTTLLEQIIDTEVDLTLDRYCREKGITVSDDTAFCWKHRLLSEISACAIDHARHHTLSPDEMQALLHERLAHWMAEDIDADMRNPTILPQSQPFSLFTRLLVYCHRPGLKKRCP